jgi:TonB family protein
MKLPCKEIKFAIALSCALHVAALEFLISAGGGKHRSRATSEEHETQFYLIELSSDALADTLLETKPAPSGGSAEPATVIAELKPNDEAVPELKVEEDVALQPTQSSIPENIANEAGYIAKSEIPEASTVKSVASLNVSLTSRDTKIESIALPPPSTINGDTSYPVQPLSLTVTTQLNNLPPEPTSLLAKAKSETGAKSLEPVRFVENGNSAPTYRKTRKPLYPARSRARGEQGTVLLHVSIDESGRPNGITIKKSSGYGDLDAAARTSVRQWLFEPARSGGVGSKIAVEVPVTFKLTQE